MDEASVWLDVVPGNRPDAPPLIALHGGLGLDHTTLRPWLDPLATEASALVYLDLRGNGRSSEPADWGVIDHATFVADIDVVCDHLTATGLPAERVVLFGHSYGGFLALEFALRYPERLAGLVLCATAPSFRHGAAIVANVQARGTPAELAAALALFGGPVADDAALAAGMRVIQPLYFHTPTPERCSEVFGDVRYRAGACNRALFGLAPAYDLRGRLGGLDAALAAAGVPVLLMSGADDWVMPKSDALEALAVGLPSAACISFAHSGHFPFVEEPQKFTAVMIAWLLRITCCSASQRLARHEGPSSS